MSRHDLIVIGAGIHGAGVAQAAAARGLRVLLLEQHAPAYGTSSRSSKLIHGGLRYLENGQFSLVAESLAERALMLKNAPELVRLQAFHVPIYRNTRRRPWQIGLGLSLYAVLGRFGRGTRFGVVPRRTWDQLDGLNTDGLQSVFRYYDGQTDDAALTRAVVRSAQRLDAELVMPARFVGAQLQDDGLQVSYEMAGRTLHADAAVLVNAAGPWAKNVLEQITPALPVRPVELVQGTHIVLPGEIARGIYYVESPRDGRAVFVMPWRGQTMIGTTETRYRGDPEQVRPLPSEINYLLQVLRHYFPARRGVSVHDISSSFAGLRVLPASGEHAFHRPRETMLDVDRPHRPRVLSIFGGKLTGWRATAEQVMQRIASSLPVRTPRADTRRIILTVDP